MVINDYQTDSELWSTRLILDQVLDWVVIDRQVQGFVPDQVLDQVLDQ